jgi:hypothetical protein
MTEKERQELIQRYAGLSDEVLLGLLRDKDAGLIAGAYDLALDEANKRKQANPNFKIPESQTVEATTTKKQNKFASGTSFLNWKIILFCCLALTVQQFIKNREAINNQKTVDIHPTAKIVIPKLSDKDRRNFKEVETILMDEMTPDEKAKYLSLDEKVINHTTTKQDFIDNGNITIAVRKRLPPDKKEIVDSFYKNQKERFNADIQNNLK